VLYEDEGDQTRRNQTEERVRVAVDDDRGPVGVAVDGGDGGGDELKVYSHEHSMCCSPSSQNIVISRPDAEYWSRVTVSQSLPIFVVVVEKSSKILSVGKYGPVNTSLSHTQSEVSTKLLVRLINLSSLSTEYSLRHSFVHKSKDAHLETLLLKPACLENIKTEELVMVTFSE
jgi:hypothetical protein